MAFLFTKAPWRPGKRNRRYGMTAGIYAGEGKDRIELGRMYIGSPEYEANFSLVLAAPRMAHTLRSLLTVPSWEQQRAIITEVLTEATTIRSAQ